MVVSPAAKSFWNGRCDSTAMRYPLPTMSRKAITIANVPIMPSSSPMAAKMKSLDASGIWVGTPSPMPLPYTPPAANAYHDWMIW